MLVFDIFEVNVLCEKVLFPCYYAEYWLYNLLI